MATAWGHSGDISTINNSPGGSTASQSSTANYGNSSSNATSATTNAIEHTVPPPPQQSCSFCRRRKIKCDKSLPSCTQCLKTNAQCVYPASQRKGRPRTGNTLATGQTREEQLLRRIKKLESIIESSQSENLHGDDSVNDLSKPLGKLTIGKPYLNHAFWISKELKDVLGSSSDEDESEVDNASLPTESPGSSDDFVFGISPVVQDLSGFHPPRQHIMQYWAVYLERCERLLRMAHSPSTSVLIDDAVQNDFHNISQTDELFLFCIYFAAITTLTSEEVSHQFGTDRSSLLVRYEFAIKQALIRARFLQTQDFRVLQALVLFLLCIKSNDPGMSAVMWSMIGLALRIAQGMALDRDGELFGLPPFEVEMRRRIWYQIVFLDLRNAEARGNTPTFLSYDTKLPTLVNETSIYPGMTESPKAEEGLCDLTLLVMRFDIVRLNRRLHCTNARDVPLSIAGKKKCIEQFRQSLKDKYIRHCIGNGDLPEYSAKTALMITNRANLTLYQDKIATASQSERDWLFLICIEIMEYYLDISGPKLKNYAWLLKVHQQWHAIAYALAELCHRKSSPDTDRAWRVIDDLKAEWRQPADAAGTLVYSSVKKLLAKAQSHREACDALLQANLAAAQTTANLKAQDGSTFLTLPSENFSQLHYDYGAVYADPVSCPQQYTPNSADIQMISQDFTATTLPEWFYSPPGGNRSQPRVGYNIADMTWGVLNDRSMYNEYNDMLLPLSSAQQDVYTQMQTHAQQLDESPAEWHIPLQPQSGVLMESNHWQGGHG